MSGGSVPWMRWESKKCQSDYQDLNIITAKLNINADIVVQVYMFAHACETMLF